MNLKALITTLVLGSSSLAASSAMAGTYQPSTYQPGAQQGERWNHKTEALQALTSPINLAGRAPTTLCINANVDRLALEMVRGSSKINSVTLVYANGRKQTVAINELLYSQNRTISVPVNRHFGEIRDIKIAGRSNGQSTFRILGA